MKRTLHRTANLLSATLLAVGLAAAPRPAEAQIGPLAMHDAYEPRGGGEVVSNALARGRYAVVIDLDSNRLYFKQGNLTLWSAPIGTGTGLRLKADDQEWDFSTPRGVFQVQFKEQNPTWIAPDWYFIEHGLPVPPPNDKRRLFPGALGAAAVYIGHDLAIHGTDKPELLGQRVSHGCIRLSDKDAKRLFHNVQIGTEVVIVGGEREEAAPKVTTRGNDPSTFNPAKPRPRPKDAQLERWKGMSSEELLQALDDEIWTRERSSRWTEVAGLLLERALNQDDDLALQGLMVGGMDLPNAMVEREYRTFLADAFARRPTRTLEVLADLAPGYREPVAKAIVAATMELYPGEWDETAAPWPTVRVPRSTVSPEGRRGWYALQRAEESYRTGAERRSL